MKGYDAYKETQIKTADSLKLIVMLYDGAIKFLNGALEFLKEKRYDRVNTNIIKAQDIIAELLLSLDLENGGEIAKNLQSLYLYMNKRLLEGNISKKPEPIQEVIKLLSNLREAWYELSKRVDTSQIQTENGASKPTGGINVAG